MTPTAPKSLYATAHFTYTGPWAMETAQFGMRLGVTSSEIMPPKGIAHTPELASAWAPSFVAGDDATWEYASNWSARWGAGFFVETDQQIAVADAVLAYWNSIKDYAHSNIRLTSVKVAPIQADGLYAYPSSVFNMKTPQPGGMTSAAIVKLPPQDAICATLRAPVIGRRGRGRFFLPGVSAQACGAGASDYGLVTPGIRTIIANGTKALVDGLPTLWGGETEARPYLMIGSAASVTFIRPTQARCGDEFDTQRRREQQREQVYTSASLD